MKIEGKKEGKIKWIGTKPYNSFGEFPSMFEGERGRQMDPSFTPASI